MSNIPLFLFLIVILVVIGAIKKSFPEKWEKYEKIVQTILSAILIGIMGFGTWYMLARSNADMETKIIYILVISVLIVILSVWTVISWKKQNAKEPTETDEE